MHCFCRMLFLKIVFLYYTMLLAFTRCLLLLLLPKVHHHKIKKRCVAVPHFKMNYYGAIIFLPCGFFYLSFFFFPCLIAAVADWMSTILLLHMVCSLSATLGCRSEMCCARLTRNTGCKNDTKNRRLGTIAQLCQAVSS